MQSTGQLAKSSQLVSPSGFLLLYLRHGIPPRVSSSFLSCLFSVRFLPGSPPLQDDLLSAGELPAWAQDPALASFLGERAVGAVSAVVVASAAMLALPLGRLGRSLGTQRPVVALGGACFGLFAVATLIFSREALGRWAAAVALAVVFGTGRATWEGNFKSSVADDFHDNTATAAFANVTVQSGLASTLGFFLNAHAPPRLVAIIVVACSVAAATAQAIAAKIRSEPRTTYAATDVV